MPHPTLIPVHSNSKSNGLNQLPSIRESSKLHDSIASCKLLAAEVPAKMAPPAALLDLAVQPELNGSRSKNVNIKEVRKR